MKISDIVKNQLWGMKVVIQSWSNCNCELCQQGYGFIQGLEFNGDLHGSRDVINISSKLDGGSVKGFYPEQVSLYGMPERRDHELG